MEVKFVFQRAKNNQIKVLFTIYDRLPHLLKISNKKNMSQGCLELQNRATAIQEQ